MCMSTWEVQLLLLPPVLHVHCLLKAPVSDAPA